VSREELHLHRIEARGYRRQEALYDVEARITDTKSQALTLDHDVLLPRYTRGSEPSRPTS
jgi:hypothetical protein